MPLTDKSLQDHPQHLQSLPVAVRVAVAAGTADKPDTAPVRQQVAILGQSERLVAAHWAVAERSPVEGLGLSTGVGRHVAAPGTLWMEIRCYYPLAVYLEDHLDHPWTAEALDTPVRVVLVVAVEGMHCSYGPEPTGEVGLGDMTVYCRWEIHSHSLRVLEGCHC